MTAVSTRKVSNIIRAEIIRKGFATKSDIKKFIPCGQTRAVQLYEKIKKKVEIKGEEIGLFGLDPIYLCEELHITPEQIERWAAEEREEEVRKNGTV